MNDFSIWFSLGFGHIIEPGALDHILFLTVLAVSYPSKDWKKTMLLLIGFTIGHTLSMALSVLTKLTLPVEGIELVIALSIVITALIALFGKPQKNTVLLLITISLFGCVHGLGFSLALRSLLSTNGHIVLPLLYFNVGLEIAQIIIVLAVLVFSLFLTSIIHIPEKIYKYTTICITGLIALSIVAQRFWLLYSA
jgi:hypothetical protein